MKNIKGFTLIEILLVILILGILAVVLLPGLLGSPSKARDTERIANVQKLAGKLATTTTTGTLLSYGCADLSHDLGGLIKPSDFGGKMLNDPANRTLLNSNPACTGYFVFKNNSSESVQKYKFAVVAALENPQNGGNISCPDFSSNEINLDEWNLSTSSTTTNCYVVLMQ